MLSEERMTQLNKLEAFLGLKFINISLLSHALTHSSYSFEQNLDHTSHNERMEFLGDAVLKIVITDYLYKTYPEQDEGKLSKRQSMLISDSLLAKKAKDISLSEYILFGKNEYNTGGANVASNLSDAMEALFAAAYLDQGLKAAKIIIYRIYETIFDETESIDYLTDFKSILQEYTQDKGIGLPNYVVTEESGPSHDKLYTISATINFEDSSISHSGTGKSKKSAEQTAAKKIIEELEL